MREIAGDGWLLLVDDEDFSRLSQIAWRMNKSGYLSAAIKLGSWRTVCPHQLLLAAPRGFEVDHIDRNKLNNQKQNLRLASKCQNRQNRGLQSNNSSGIKGVSWHAASGRWRAAVQAFGVEYRLGSFVDLETAQRAVKEKRLELHGSFACNG